MAAVAAVAAVAAEASVATEASVAVVAVVAALDLTVVLSNELSYFNLFSCQVFLFQA